jgi:hypothetical protein
MDRVGSLFGERVCSRRLGRVQPGCNNTEDMPYSAERRANGDNKISDATVADAIWPFVLLRWPETKRTPLV